MDVFKFPKNVEDSSVEFLRSFLLSHDFTQNQRKRIGHSLNLSVQQNSQAAQLSSAIAEYIGRMPSQNIHGPLSLITCLLTQRPRRYVTLQFMDRYELPTLNDPTFLPVTFGEQGWYGPIRDNDHSNRTWYVRTSLFDYEEQEQREIRNADGELEIITEVKRYTIRWLCFACVEGHALSLHWTNFQIDDGLITINRKRQMGKFPYWDFIPQFLEEIQRHLKTKAYFVRFDRVIFDKFWYSFRHDKALEWTDARIRGEQKGVALTASGRAAKRNAKAQPVKPIDENEESNGDAVDVVGIRSLAQTIRLSVDAALKRTQGVSIQDAEFVDDEILRALIMKHNPISYEVKIRGKTDGMLIYGADAYFGKKSGHTPDSFYHLHLQNINEVDGLGHVNLFMRDLDLQNHLEKDDGSDISQQLGLL